MRFDLKQAEALVDAYSAATGLGCTLTRTPSQARLCARGYTCQVCRLCRALGVDETVCAHDHMYGLNEAKRFGGRYIYFCRRGLSFFVSPLIGRALSEARFTVGPFLMVDAADFCACELDGDESHMDLVRELPFVEPEKVTRLSLLLFMATGFLNDVASSERMLEQEEIDAIQGRITAYILETKRAGEAARYPYDKERALLDAMAGNDRTEANRLLNELLGHILLSDAADFGRVKARVSALMAVITRSAIENGADPERLDGACVGYFERLLGIGDMPELCRWLSVAMNELMDAAFAFRELKHADAICRCVQYIQTHLSENLELGELAARAYLSPAYFGRVFKRETGRSLRAYVLEARLEKSAELIRYEKLKIAEVAQLTGFQDQSYFTRAFCKKFGLSPNEYRRKFRI